MTTLDGTERELRRRDGAGLRPQRARRASPGSWAAQVSEVSESTTRVLLEVATWNGVNILRTSRKLGLRSDASNRFEKQLHPELAIRAQRIASKLMVELCGADARAGHDRRRRRAAAAHVGSRCAAPASSALLGMRDRRAERARVPGAGSTSRSSPTARTSRPRCPLHRHYDVTREVDLIEEVGRIHGYADHLPTPLPERAGQAGAADPRAAAAPPRRGRDPRPRLRRGRHPEPHRPGDARPAAARGRRRCAPPPIRVSNPLSQRPLGDADDPARRAARRRPAQPRPRRRARRPVRVRARVPARGACPPTAGRSAGQFAGDRPAPAFEPHRIGALVVGPLRLAGVAAATRGRRTSSRSRARSRRSCAQLGPCRRGRAGRRALPASRARRPGAARRRAMPAGSASSTRWSAATGTSTAAAAFEVDLAALVAAALAVGSSSYEDVISYPGGARGHRGRRRRRRAAARVRDAVLEGGGELLRSAEVFDLYRGEQVGEGRKSLALRLEFRAPDRTLTDEEVAERRSAITEALGAIGGSAWLSSADPSPASRRRARARDRRRRLRVRRRARRPSSSGAIRRWSSARSPRARDAGTPLDRALPALPGARSS